MAGARWLPAEDADLRELYPTRLAADVAEILNRRHGNARSAGGVRQRALKLGVPKAEGYRGLKPRRFWTDERRAWFAAFVPGHTEPEISAEHERVFGTPLTEGQIGSAKASLGVRSGTHGGRFVKGQRSWNKGLKWDEYLSPEAQESARRTCFAKGNMPHNARDKEIGCERVDRDGYAWVKIAERPSSPSCNDNWRQKSHLVWEEANGRSVPESTNIVFANRDRGDFRPENLVAVPRSIWAVIVRNDLDFYDAASLEACMNVARLMKATSAAEHAPRDCRRCGASFEPRYPRQRTCDSCLGREKVV